MDPKIKERVARTLEGKTNYTVVSNKNIEMALILQEQHKRTGMLSVRALNYVDANTIHIFGWENIHKLFNSLPEKTFPIISVFDSFRCHPNNVNEMRQQYNNIISEIAYSNILNHSLSLALGKEINIKKQDTSWFHLIKDANYALS